MRRYINTYETDYNLIPISAKTLSKLLIGKFKTLEELANTDSDPSLSKVEILYREIKNKNRDQFIYLIETIFINE